MSAGAHTIDLFPVIALLGAGVIAGALFKRIGLGSVLGYLAGGVAIGPFGLQVFEDSSSILHVAELGVVMFLFVIGLEMRPARLWALRSQIFGLGLLQVTASALALTAVGVLTGFPVAPSFVAGAGFVLTSTAIVMQLLQERGTLPSTSGQKVVAVLLLEDLAIVPLLAFVTFLAPIAPGNHATGQGLEWVNIAIGVASIAALVVAGRYLLNPLFGLVASIRAREVMTAAALMVVLGYAYLMEVSGLSMAMGAFLAGVLLSESTFRHQLEADIEPFRGILLGLFFLAVGMALNLEVIGQNWRLIVSYVVAFMIVKGVVVYAVGRLLRDGPPEAFDRALMMAQGGEFAFVLYAAAAALNIITADQNAVLTAIVIISMVLTPLLIASSEFLRRTSAANTDGVETPDGLNGTVLVVGFGRVGQVVCQLLLAKGHEISIIDTDVEMINVARDFDFKVYYGDGRRLDILHSAGAAEAKAIVVCVDELEGATEIVELVKAEFPQAAVLARSVDRRHALELVKKGVDFQIRETFESALILGRRTLEALGIAPDDADATVARVRRRDGIRFDLEMNGGLTAGRSLFSGRSTEQEQNSEIDPELADADRKPGLSG